MDKANLTGEVRACTMSVMYPRGSKNLYRTFVSQVKSTTGNWMLISDPTTPTKSIEGKTQEEAVQNGMKWVEKVYDIPTFGLEECGHLD